MKLYAPVVTLSIQYNARLLQTMKYEFKRIINWDKYQWKLTAKSQKQYLDYLIDPGFQGMKRHFVINGRNFFNQHNRYDIY